MSGIEGVAVVQHPFFPTRYVELASLFPGERATHRAFPEPVADALVAVAEAAQKIHDDVGGDADWYTTALVSSEKLAIALDALAEAQTGAA